ncbi:hypothetical protein BUALT_Bualt06G0117700 [Buddleja alternifolia]|uniref:Uncharacterized protein n=1 Tax=Buddleja alternifolia TaxID=168488 RepID=A0AAV6XIS6_9LAMI|nr:hypothetical protein BUALT_Bualt06G0117700 [Buddleja alternifolia]
MGCQIHCLNTQLLYKNINTKNSSSYFPFQQSYKLHKNTILSSYNNLNDQQLTSTATKTQTDYYNVKFKTLGACKLGISMYPDFEYNAEGGIGSGTATKISDTDEFFPVDFDEKSLYIPPLSTSTTKFLGLPLPPFLKIEIFPEVFHGKINRESGQVDLKFRAKFSFSVGSIYQAPPLLVETVLTSEESKGKIRRGKGERLNKDGICRLVGVATIEPINDFFMNTFLSLPTECLADLNAEICFQ